MVEEIPDDLGAISPLQTLTDEVYVRKRRGNMTEAERARDPDWQAFFKYIQNHLDTQFFWDAVGNAALESNQDFSDKQFAYGIQAGAVVRAWLRAEVAFKTGMGRFLEKPLWFSLSYRYFREMNSSVAIRAAHLDEHSYLAASFEFLDGFSFTYSNGKLPFDHDSDQVFALGY